MAFLAAGIWVVGAAPAFSLAKLEIHGARFTSEAAIRTAAGLSSPGNSFRFRSDSAATRIAELPAVLTARVAVRLPGTVSVTIEERTPVLVWVAGSRRLAVDETGFVFGLVDESDAPIASSSGPVTPRPAASALPESSGGPAGGASPSAAGGQASEAAASGAPGSGSPAASASSRPSASASALPSASPSVSLPSLAPAPTPPATGVGSLSLPVVVDRRAASASLGIGDSIDMTTLDAAYRLARLTPAEVLSSARSLSVVVDDRYGFTVSSVPRGWVAEFGFYTLTVRRPETVVATQVRDLKSLFGSVGEARVGWVFLTSDLSSDHTSTYIPR